VPVTVCLLALAAGAPCALAQDPVDGLAERLKSLIDRRLDEVRAELHREIDAALSGPESVPGLTTRRVSAEFCELHRLPQGSGLVVEAVDGDGWSVRPGDVIVGIAGKPVRGPRDLAWKVAVPAEILLADVVRKGERQLMIWESPERQLVASSSADRQPETADQMLDRLWQKALKKTVETGIEPVAPQNPLPESSPVGISPIPAKDGRR
jgi:hypothetical protein